MWGASSLSHISLRLSHPTLDENGYATQPRSDSVTVACENDNDQWLFFDSFLIDSKMGFNISMMSCAGNKPGPLVECSDKADTEVSA